MAGTYKHEALEKYELEGIETPILELKNYKVLKRLYGFEVEETEKIVIIEYNGKVVCAGMIDQIIRLPIMVDENVTRDIRCINDFKRTSTFDKEWLAWQETMYAIGYEQSYGKQIDALYGTHLRNDKKAFKKIPAIYDDCFELLKEVYEEQKVELFL